MNFNAGVYTVIPTFFKNSEVDFEQLEKSINYQINNNVKNIILLGTTSETPTLSNSEQERIVKTSWEKFKGKINIIIGIGTNNTKTTLENAFKFRDYCDAFMVTTPYYNKPSQEGIYQHFSTIAQLIEDKPIMLYNIPSRTGVSIDPEIVANLYNSFDNIKAIKEASGSIQYSLEIKNLCDIVILSGDDALTLPLMSIGALGVVSVASNIIPMQMVTLVELFINNKIDNSVVMNKKLYPLFKSLFVDTNPVPLKYLMVKLGLASDESVRLPLVKIQSLDIKQQLDCISNMVNINNDTTSVFNQVNI
jgi:4-hydroxy-tetrahydrodipicolinate synthase